MSPADPKPAPRIKDPKALATARLAGDECAACGWLGTNVHHVIQRSEGGDDVPGNLLLLCGSGTERCHGAYHGSPYVTRSIRRDQEWVARRIGRHIASRRPDIISYVLSKLGDGPGRDYLARVYYLEELPDD